MALPRVPARDIVIEASDGQATPTWVEIAGLTSFMANNGENQEVAATTTFDSNGMYEEQVMQRGALITLVGRVLQDPTTGERDPGQAQVETNAEGIAATSLAMYRFRLVGDTQWKIWEATTTVGEVGGELNAMSAWNVTIRRSGASTTEAVA